MFHIRISLSTNSWLKLTIAIFLTKFVKKVSYFQSRTDKIDTAVEFCIFELQNFRTKLAEERCLWSATGKLNVIIEFRLFKLVLVPNFILN